MSDTVVMCPGCGVKVGERHTPGCVYRSAEALEAARAVGDLPYVAANALYKDSTRGPDGLTAAESEGTSDTEKFLRDVAAEVAKARAKFGGQSSEMTGLALAEEINEVHLAVALGARQPIKKILHIKEGKSGEDDLYLECVQVAAMALRLALESDDRREWAGNKRGCGGSYEVGSGGHVPGIAGEGCEACDRDFGPAESPRPRFPRRAD